jgi:hypothetical protein
VVDLDKEDRLERCLGVWEGLRDLRLEVAVDDVEVCEVLSLELFDGVFDPVELRDTFPFPLTRGIGGEKDFERDEGTIISNVNFDLVGEAWSTLGDFLRRGLGEISSMGSCTGISNSMMDEGARELGRGGVGDALGRIREVFDVDMSAPCEEGGVGSLVIGLRRNVLDSAN